MTDEGIDRELVRLKWRCRRGMLELDIILADFVERRYGELSAAEREAFTRLLDKPDDTLLRWLVPAAKREWMTDDGEQPDPELKALVEKIR